MTKSNKTFLDSSLVFFGAGEIGYRWAVKMLYLGGTRKVSFFTDTFFFQEILDRFTYLKKRELAEILFRQGRKVVTEVEGVSEEDFVQSMELYKKYDNVSPRVLLHVAVMKRKGAKESCSAFSTGVEFVEEVKRVNFLDRVEEVGELCS